MSQPTELEKQIESLEKESPKYSKEADDLVPKPRIKKKWKKPLLPKDVKKQNHITSEHKRRNNIHQKLEKLYELVPSLSGEPEKKRSELFIYPKTIEYLRELYQENVKLRKALLEKCGPSTQIGDHLIWDDSHVKQQTDSIRPDSE